MVAVLVVRQMHGLYRYHQTLTPTLTLALAPTLTHLVGLLDTYSLLTT